MLRGLKPISLPTTVAGYRRYEAMTVNGAVEIIVHRALEPRFYVTDDQAV